jgi:hypothetical protein
VVSFLQNAFLSISFTPQVHRLVPIERHCEKSTFAPLDDPVYCRFRGLSQARRWNPVPPPVVHAALPRLAAKKCTGGSSGGRISTNDVGRQLYCARSSTGVRGGYIDARTCHGNQSGGHMATQTRWRSG